MEDSKKNKLLEANVNLEVALNRFLGNYDLLIRMLKKFPADENFAEMEKAILEERYEDAFKSAHALKGLCGNLALDSMFNIVSDEVELLRTGNKKEAEETLAKVKSEYERVSGIIESI